MTSKVPKHSDSDTLPLSKSKIEWVIAYSSSRKRNYYFNTRTGERSWDRPALLKKEQGRSVVSPVPTQHAKRSHATTSHAEQEKQEAGSTKRCKRSSDVDPVSTEIIEAADKESMKRIVAEKKCGNTADYQTERVSPSKRKRTRTDSAIQKRNVSPRRRSNPVRDEVINKQRGEKDKVKESPSLKKLTGTPAKQRKVLLSERKLTKGERVSGVTTEETKYVEVDNTRSSTKRSSNKRRVEDDQARYINWKKGKKVMKPVPVPVPKTETMEEVHSSNKDERKKAKRKRKAARRKAAKEAIAQRLDDGQEKRSFAAPKPTPVCDWKIPKLSPGAKHGDDSMISSVPKDVTRNSPCKKESTDGESNNSKTCTDEDIINKNLPHTSNYPHTHSNEGCGTCTKQNINSSDVIYKGTVIIPPPASNTLSSHEGESDVYEDGETEMEVDTQTSSPPNNGTFSHSQPCGSGKELSTPCKTGSAELDTGRGSYSVSGEDKVRHGEMFQSKLKSEACRSCTQQGPSKMGDGIQDRGLDHAREWKDESVGTTLQAGGGRLTGTETDMTIDVDFPVGTEGKIFLVVDTNVLLSGLTVLENLKGRTIAGLGDVVLIIPWVVMMELDNLKGPNHSSLSGCKGLPAAARKASNFLHSHKTDPGIRGQSYTNYLQSAKDVAYAENADDQILQYCLHCKDKYVNNIVALMTNDKNLSVKASYSGLLSSGHNDFVKEIKKQMTELGETLSGLPSVSSNQLSGPSSPPLQDMTKEASTPGKDDVRTTSAKPLPNKPTSPIVQVKDHVRKMLDSLQLLLADVLEREMIEGYTNHWKEIVHRKPPWSLLDVLESMKKHYIAVFGLLLGRQRKDNLEDLISTVIKVENGGPINKTLIDVVRFNAMAVMVPLSKNAKYKGPSTKCIQEIENIYNTWSAKPKFAFGSSTESKEHVNSSVERQSSECSVAASESENMIISPAVSACSSTEWFQTGKESSTKNQPARGAVSGSVDGGVELEGWNREGVGGGRGGETEGTIEAITFTVMSIFEAVWTLLQHNRDAILSSIKCSPEEEHPQGLPTKAESLEYLASVLPLVEGILDSLQRLLSSMSPDLLLFNALISSLQTFIQTFKVEVDASGLQPRVLQQFLSSEDNVERLRVGGQQLYHILQQLNDCVLALSQ